MAPIADLLPQWNLVRCGEALFGFCSVSFCRVLGRIMLDNEDLFDVVQLVEPDAGTCPLPCYAFGSGRLAVSAESPVMLSASRFEYVW